MSQKNPSDYPYILTAKEVAEILSISKAKAYDLFNLTSFPAITLGRNKRVKRDAFFEWIDSQVTQEIA
ncbi:MAG: helix-turn-helix domain-containing protein [Heyndrickxia sp.]